ncbi:MAG: methyl-accepting chemotaxis protein [FCB group bacterium]|nr:methyl-accepting chemotaxis protein [FCB group bacterium]
MNVNKMKLWGAELFSTIKLGTLLNFGFLLSFIAVAAVGLLSVERMSNMSKELAITSAQTAEVSETLNKVKVGSDKASLKTREVKEDMEEKLIKMMRTNTTDMKSMIGTFENIISTLRELTDSDEEDDAVILSLEVEDVYEKFQREVLPLIRSIAADLEHSAEEGQNMISTINTVQEQLDLFAELSMKAFDISKNIDERSQLTANAADRSKRGMMLILVFSAGLVLLVAIVTKFSVSRAITKITERFKDIAMGEGDLTSRLEVASKDELGELARWFNVFVEKIQNTVKTIKKSADQIGDAAAQISAASNQLARGAEEQQTHLGDVASSMEEMSAMIVEASTNTGETQRNTQIANEATKKGQEAISKTISGIEKIAEIVNSASEKVSALERRSKEIGEVIRVIDDIAEQTNLLALNANIEAARAGEAGRGFAVVADEVRKLADRTVNATSEIADQIKQIQVDVDLSVSAMEEIQNQAHANKVLSSESGSALASIASTIESTAQAMNEIASASSEQSTGAEDISMRLETINTVSQQAASGANELAKSTVNLNQEVQNLNAVIGQFKI